MASTLGVLFAIAPAAGYGVAKQNSPKLQQAPPSTQAAPGELQHAREMANSGHATEAEASVRQFLQANANASDGHFLLGYILFREIQEQAGAKSAMHYDPNAEMAKFRDAHAR